MENRVMKVSGGGSNAAESSRKTRKSCHQCRNMKSHTITVPCKNQRTTGKTCPLVYCQSCLTRKYEKEKEVKEPNGLGNWICPRCRDICTCSECRRKKTDHVPIAATRQASGMSRVPEIDIDLNLIPEDGQDQELKRLVGIDMAKETQTANRRAMDPDAFAKAFVEYYYTTFDSNRGGLGIFYEEGSVLTFEGEKIMGSQNIVRRIVGLPFHIKHNVSTVDCQPSGPCSCMLVFVTGSLQPPLSGVDPLQFSQMFHLMPTPQGKFYVKHDIFRLNCA